MQRDDFNDYVRGVVSAGGSVELGGIATKLDVPKADAKKWLEAMYEAGELELDLDDNDAFIYRKGKKLGPAKGHKITGALAPLGTQALASAATEAMKEKAKEALLGDDNDDPTKKKVLWGMGLGFLLPGAGLFYAAPWVTAIVATVGVAILFAILSVLSNIPILGGMVMYIVIGALMVASGALGAIYTWQYNKNGARTRLSKGTPEKRALPF